MRTPAGVLRRFGGPFAIEEVEVASPGPGEVLVEMVASGVCGSDLHIREGRIPAPLPIVGGHEGVGIVREVGPGVCRVSAGARVLLAWVAACGVCGYCHSGRTHLCETSLRASLAGQLRDGTTRFSDLAGESLHHHLMVSSFSHHSVVMETAAVPVPNGLPLPPLALLGCGVATGVGAAVRTGRIELGDVVAVWGCGAVGLSAMQGAGLRGAARIVAIDVQPPRLEAARRFGATATIDASEEDPVAVLSSLTGGEGVDVAIEAIGRPDTLGAAVRSLRRGGVAVAVGMAAPGTALTVEMLHLLDERRLTGCYYGTTRPQHDLPRLMELYRSGRLLVDELVTDELDQADLDRALDNLAEGKGIRSLIRY